MAYFRGDPYIWSDGNFLHIWTEDGRVDIAERNPQYAGKANAGGVMVSEKTMDQFVVMRFAELLELGTLVSTVKATLDGKGRENFGCESLSKYETLLAARRCLLAMQPSRSSLD